MSEYQTSAKVLEQAWAAGYDAFLREGSVNAAVKTATPLIAAAAYHAGREHELRAAADDMEATDRHTEGWDDCLNDRPHVKAAGNCIIPPQWLRDRADRIARDYGAEVHRG